MKIKKDGWLNRLLEGETQKIELLVSLSPQKVIEKLCFWGKSQGGVSDICSVCLENGQEVITAVFSRGNVTLLAVAKQEQNGTIVYLSGSMAGAYFPLHYREIKKCLKEIKDLLLPVTLKK